VSFWLFAAFLLALFALGGSGSDAAATQLILRPLSVLFLGAALSRISPGTLRPYAVPLGIVCATIVLALFQTIPLPPAMWSALPVRDVLLPGLQILGIDGVWRPLTLSPPRTWNSIYAFLTPITAILLYARLPRRHFERLLMLILGFAVLNSLVMLAQLLGPPGAFRLFGGEAVRSVSGLFANRNHAAVFLGTVMPVIAALHVCRSAAPTRAAESMVYAVAALFLFTMIVASGSRIGLLAALIGVIASAMILSSDREMGGWRRRIIGPVAIVSAALIAALIYLFTAQTAAFDRLFASDAIDDTRFAILPISWDMAKALFPYGGGFGAYADIYRMFEPEALLGPRSMNNAHLDPLEYVIEGGLAALLILAVGAAWWLRRLAGAMTAGGGVHLRLGLSVSAILAVASLTTFPLRTPIVGVLFVLALCWMADRSGRRL
jgi:hypothetical protein